MSHMSFLVKNKEGEHCLELSYDRVFAIGYSGRNIEKTKEHIRELEAELGVPAPSRIPTIFQCGNYVLTQEEDVAFLGSKTSGEVEYVIVLSAGHIYIGLGSDHTDRALEATNVPKAKQICAKPICGTLWEYEEIREHWDEILVKSWQVVDGEQVLYQDGSLSDILPVEVILEELEQRVGGIDNCVIFSGTVPLVNGYRYGTRFSYVMQDPILNRSLQSAYNIISIPEAER